MMPDYFEIATLRFFRRRTEHSVRFARPAQTTLLVQISFLCADLILVALRPNCGDWIHYDWRPGASFLFTEWGCRTFCGLLTLVSWNERSNFWPLSPNADWSSMNRIYTHSCNAKYVMPLNSSQSPCLMVRVSWLWQIYLNYSNSLQIWFPASAFDYYLY